MSTQEPANIVRRIIQSEMELAEGNVMFTNQKQFIPTDPLRVVVSYVGPSRVISNMNTWEDDGADGLIEVQSVNYLHLIQIDIMSFDNSSRQRKEEIAMALRSIFSEQQQETYGMSIARQPGIMSDTSFLEETKIITRYTTSIVVTSTFEKRKAIDSYTSFKAQLNIDPKTPAPIEVDPIAAHP